MTRPVSTQLLTNHGLLSQAGAEAGHVVALDEDGNVVFSDSTLVATDLSVYQPLEDKDQPNGYAGLDGDSLLDPAQVPASVAVPDASGASAGDILTADGNGGFAWLPPA